MTVTGLAIHFDPSGDVFVSVESWGITGDGSAEKIAVLERPKQVKMQRDRLAADIRLTRSGTGLLLHTTLAGSAHFFSEGGTNVPVTVSGVDGDANSSGSVVRPTLVAIGTKISVRDLTVLWGESLSAPTAAAGCAQSSSAAKALAVKDQRPLAMPPNSQAAVTFPELAERIENEILDRSPGVAWEDVAGLEDAKRLLNEAVVLPVLVPELFRAQGGIRPWKGVLLYGPPGTGKTLLAKAVATASKLTFFNMSSSTLLMKHFGESEKMVKTLFQVARHYSPSVVFFDEIDALMGSRGDTGDSGGGSAEVMRRVRAEMLSQIDGLHDGNAESRVVVIATTNCPWDVDEAMRRRLEKRIYVPLPDAATRTNMIRQCCKSAEIDNSVDYAAVSAQCEGLSGADISVLCREALMGPVRRLISGRSPAELASMNQRGEMKVQAVLAEDFEAALQRIHSSVGSLSRFEEWHAQFGSN
jgi:SpoVK/Ycf46/Vps4 family AAA+-type ATPase